MKTAEDVQDKIWTIINKALEKQGKELLLSVREILDIENEIEQYAQHRVLEEKLIRDLFVGKVSEIIGFDKAVELLKESKEAISTKK